MDPVGPMGPGPRPTVGRTGGRTDLRTEGRASGGTDRPTDGWTDGHTDRQIGRMNGSDRRVSLSWLLCGTPTPAVVDDNISSIKEEYFVSMQPHPHHMDL
jgi:hypothetical protein